MSDSDLNLLKISFFSTLPTKEARRSVYQLLLNQLQPDEWRDVQAQAHIRLKRDIPGLLPLEIVAEIVGYLTISDVVAFQNVSKHWKALLCSPLILSRLHYKYLRTVSGRNDLSFQEQLELFPRHAKQKARLEKGVPVDKKMYPEPRLNQPDTWVTGFDYFNGKCAWIVFGPNFLFMGTIAVRCLRTGAEQFFHDIQLGDPEAIRISDSIVATVMKGGRCYVLNHRTRESDCFALPSERYRSFVVNGTKVALCFEASEASFPESLALVWDFESKKTRKFPIKSDLVYSALSSASDSLITVHLRNAGNRKHTHAKQARLEVLRYPLSPNNNDGDSSEISEPLQDKWMKLPLDQPSLQNLWVADHPTKTPWFNDRTGILELQQKRSHKKDFPSGIVFVWYDLVCDEVFVHTDVWSNRMMAHITPDLHYLIGGDGDEDPVVKILNPDVSKSAWYSEHMAYIWEPSSYSCIFVYGDANFVLILTCHGLTVWCFEESFRFRRSVSLSDGDWEEDKEFANSSD